MRKGPVQTALATGLSLVVGMSATAQAGVDLGFKAGINMASASGEVRVSELDVDEFSSRTGLALGAYLVVNINETFAIQPELLYMQGGTKIDEMDVWYYGDDWSAPGTWAMEAKHSCLEIPVLAKLKIPTKGVVTPFLYAGPSLSFNLTAENEIAIEIPAYDVSETETEDDEDISTVGFALVFGAGIDFAVGSGKVSVDGRYALGLTNMIDDPHADSDIKSRVFTVAVGYSFAVGG